MNKLLLATLLSVVTQAQAIDIVHIGEISKADAKIIVGIGSRHINSDDHKYLNESNPSIGVEAWDVQAVYVSKNSWNHKSLYLTYAPDYELNKYITLSANAGIATGYKCSNSVDIHNGVYTSQYCNKIGIVALGAVTVDYKPFAGNTALSLSFTIDVLMLSVNYSL